MYDPLTLSYVYRQKWLSDSMDMLLNLGLPSGADDYALADMKTQVAMVLRNINLEAAKGEHIFITKDFVGLALHAAESIPDDYTFQVSELVVPEGWCFLEKPFSYEEDDYFQTLVWHYLPDQNVTQFCMLPAVFPPLLDSNRLMWENFSIREDDTLPKIANRMYLGSYGETVTTAKDHLKYVKFALAMIHLLGQKIAVTSTDRRIHNSVAGQVQKSKWNYPPRVVTLRRPVYESKESGGSVEYNCQWSVKGHWRKQPYRSTGEVRPKFIEAYIKGPADKPLKASSPVLYLAKK